LRPGCVQPNEIALHLIACGWQAGGFDPHAIAQIAGDNVARRRSRAANRVVHGVDNLNAIGAVTQRRRTRRIHADEIALHLIARSCRPANQDASVAVARNQIARAAHATAERIIGRAQRHSARSIANCRRARRVRADEVALNGIAAGSQRSDVDSELAVAAGDVAPGGGCPANGVAGGVSDDDPLEIIADARRPRRIRADQVALNLRARAGEKVNARAIARNDIARAAGRATDCRAGRIADGDTG